MSIIILPDAQADLLALQEYMLDQWSEADWITAEDEIFSKLVQVDGGFLVGHTVSELATVGILDYRNVYTSHHKLVYRRIGTDTYVYIVAGHRQEFPTLLMKRLLRA
ncbi:MAG: hypothetical protein RL651_1325 [Pseudomonadota bacterium]|jgi:plasmid stabilization system protein ParE